MRRRSSARSAGLAVRSSARRSASRARSCWPSARSSSARVAWKRWWPVQRPGQRVELGHRRPRTLGVPQRDRPVQPGHRRRSEVQEHVVEQHDLLPVGVLPALGLGMAGDDRRLQLVRPGPVLPGRPGQQAGRLGDGCPVPPRPVLFSQQDQAVLVVEAGGDPRPVQLDQREQPGHLGLGRHQPVQQAGEPLGVVGEVARVRLRRGGQVALVEQQVDHGQHAGQPVAELVGVRDPVRDAGVGDLPLGSGDPLRHGGLRQQERPRDLGRGQPAHDPQGQRDLRGLRERRMAAGEDQLQPLVLRRRQAARRSCASLAR